MARTKYRLWLFLFAFLALAGLLLGPACAPNLSQGDGGLRFCNTADDCNKQLGAGYECRLHLCQRVGECVGAGQECQVPGAKGICVKGVTACVGGDLVCQSAQQPAPAEICGNKLDDDCDGQVDIGPNCSCQPGETRPCFEDGKTGCTQDATTKKWECQGNCKVGNQTCSPSQTWGACIGATTPALEQCDGQDNDCNGQVDEDFPSKGTACGVLGQKGPCAIGQNSCDNGQVKCEQTVQPAPKEDCSNNEDDDCDGVPNGGCDCTTPGMTRPCYSGSAGTDGKGECKKGTQTCDNNGKWGACQGEVTPTTEICDSKDNDCNGQIDESFPNAKQPCKDPSRKGVCTDGVKACVNGQEICQQTVQAGPEQCNQKDDDCDGNIDNAPGKTTPLTQPCYTGPAGTRNKGACKDGSQTCSNGAWGACSGDVLPKTETCNTPAVDEDCDGQVNENPPCTCTAGQTQKCGKDTGACQQGTQTCDANGSFGACLGAINPKNEICNNIDDDCDGTADEDFPTKGSPCSAGVGECKRTGTLRCKGDGSGLECSVQAGTPATETCNGKDDDCDGSIDESLTRPCYSGPSGTQNVGVCKGGTETCSNGAYGSCAGQVIPQTEIPNNGIDEDCNGSDLVTAPPGCADNTNEQVFTSGSMVGCNCNSSPCNATTAETLCATGWRVCNFTEWKARRNNVVPNAYRFLYATYQCDTSDKSRACPCKDSSGNNCLGSIFDSDVRPTTKICFHSGCQISSAFRNWPLFTGPASPGDLDECGDKFSNWSVVKGHYVGRGRTVFSNDAASRGIPACQAFSETDTSTGSTRYFGQGAVCCKVP